ncbi:MAG: relaxase [Robiginitomaculum sp.]|nr:MAG: relaxase [Robiginitomaculum sp.]
MILKGNQRGGAKDLAVHLMKPENDHIEVYEVRGFASESVMGALNEAYALSRGTQCKQFMYSLSANPPPDKEVSTDYFIDVFNRAEKELGLTGQARVIVFHEKQGRRHAHCVWSRIIIDKMIAVHLPNTKRKLVALTRDIFIERDWKMPDGLIDKTQRNPKNFTHAQWQQAKRKGKDPRAIKTALQDAWSISDSKAAFIHALDERGFKLTRGDKRGFVVIDHRMEPYSLSKWTGQKPKTLAARLGDKNDLPSVNDTKANIRQDMQSMLKHLQGDLTRRARAKNDKFNVRHRDLVKRQQVAREALKGAQEKCRIHDNQVRQARFRRGAGGLWDKLRGEHKRIQNQNEREAYASFRQDRNEMDEIVFSHLKERKHIDIFKLRIRERADHMLHSLDRDRQNYMRGHAPEP